MAAAAALLLVLAMPAVCAADGATQGKVPTVVADPDELDDLQQRLTEREDKRRPPDPWNIELAGRPLTIGGEYETESGYLDRSGDEALDRSGRYGQTQGVELEAFYSFGPPLSLFAQGRLGAGKDLLASDVERMSDRYLERGEMWLYSENIAGSRINLDFGRLDFEDDRRWWWDADLDAVRITRESDHFEIALAFARELAPNRSDQHRIDPEQDGVQRVIAEASWDWRPNHTLQLFALHQDDRSAGGFPGQQIQAPREDPSDARLTWLGARLTGALALGRGGVLGYWFDGARVRGRERVMDYAPLDPFDSEVAGVEDHEVRGYGFDIGLNWLLPFRAEPRLFAGYAYGSGDADPQDGIDHAFRQSGLQANESGFGGVQRFAQYGFLLDPELSNLRIRTIGAGMSLLRSSSLDLVYHRYQLDQPGGALSDIRLEINPDGEQRALGSSVDVVLALEEWERFEFGLIASAFRAGRALQDGEGERSYGALLAMRIAF